MSDFGPMATQTSKPHSSAVGRDFLNSYEGVAAMRGNKVPKYGKGVTSSGAAHYPKILRIGSGSTPPVFAAIEHRFGIPISSC